MNTIVPFQTADLQIGASGADIAAGIRNIALANVAAIDDGQLTVLEKRALVAVEELKLVGGLELYAVMFRGEKIAQIQAEGLLTAHPRGYATLEEMARDNGVSIAELSRTRDFYNTIFPYIQQNFERGLPEIWQEVGKSRMGELLPVMKAVITGEEPANAKTRGAVERVVTEARTALTTRAAINNEPPPGEEDIKFAAVDYLITQGELLTNIQLRRELRPADAAELINATFVHTPNGDHFIVMKLNADDLLLIQRLLGTHIEAIHINVQTGRRQLVRTPEITALLGEINE